MADDDKDTGDAFDPWADLEADPEPAADAFSFSFEDASLDAELAEGTPSAPVELPSSDAVPASPEGLPVSDVNDAMDVFAAMDAPAGADATESPEPAAADDDLASSWLDEPVSEAGNGEQEIDLSFGEDADAPVETTLGVFSPDDAEEPQDAAEPFADFAAAGGDSAIEIGTGASGISSPSDIEAGETFAGFHEPGEGMPSADDEPAESFAFAGEEVASGEMPADETETIDFATAAAGAAAVGAALAGGDGEAAAAAPAKRPARAKAQKKSGFGQMLGVVLGGAMAIPITLAILIWGFKKDPFKVTKHVPDSVAFLLPAQFQKGYVKPLEGGPDLSAAPSLDDLPSAETAAVDAATEAAPGDVAGGEPDLTDEPAMEQPAGEPAPPEEPGTGEVATAEPTEEPAATEPPPAPPAAPEPPPLDTAAVDRAVDDAATALAALQAVADPTDPVRKTLLIDWYKQLARMAEELALLEREAADTGRPLTATPDNVGAVHAAVVATPGLVDDLERLSRNWLAYAKRGSDGVVMPAAFGGARRVGPYWRSEMTIAEAGGKSRDVTVITRTEPAALPGDMVLVTGVVLAGDVVWGSDVRPAKADVAAEPAGDPFATPDL